MSARNVFNTVSTLTCWVAVQCCLQYTNSYWCWGDCWKLFPWSL